MNFKTLSSREKKALYITVIFVIIVFLYFFIIFPLVNKWNKAQDKVAQKEVSLKKKLKVLNRASWLKKWRQSFPFDLDAPGIKQESVTKILSYIEDITRKSNLEITNISPGSIEKHGGYKFIFIKINLKGEMKNVVGFLYNLESSAMMFRVDRLEIDSAARKSGEVRVSLEIRKLMVL